MNYNRLNLLPSKMLKFLSSRPMVILICFIGFSLQLTDVVYEYLKFKVRHEVIYVHPDEVELPEVDISMTLSPLINMSKLYNRVPEKLRKLCREILKTPKLELNSLQEFNQKCLHEIKVSPDVLTVHLSQILTIGDVEATLVDLSSNITSISVQGSDEMTEKHKYCSVGKHFNGYSYFLRISCRNQTKPIVISSTRNFMGNNPIMCFTHNINRRFGFRLSPANSNIESRGSKYKIVEPTQHMIHSHFRRSISTLLPWPWSTRCVHHNRSSVFMSCMNKQLADHNSVYTDAVLPFGEYHQSEYRFTNYFDNSKLFEQMAIKCQQLIKVPECYSIKYETFTQQYSVEGGNGSLICVEPTLDPDLEIRVYPKLTLSELLIYVSSISGVWFGFSIYGTLQSNNNYVCLRSHCNRKVKTGEETKETTDPQCTSNQND